MDVLFDGRGKMYLHASWVAITTATTKRTMVEHGECSLCAAKMVTDQLNPLV
jgi:hypothetical protein